MFTRALTRLKALYAQVGVRSFLLIAGIEAAVLFVLLISTLSGHAVRDAEIARQHDQIAAQHTEILALKAKAPRVVTVVRTVQTRGRCRTVKPAPLSIPLSNRLLSNAP
ncbi:hypothetical protein ACFZ8E_07395 [Methylobacterium sp. HMF5984]|uniref:hypothetical protein n=1 Tax=Methylobacterium sp. HMF5984 TaxID=3367370 RepID=UPI00385481E2